MGLSRAVALSAWMAAALVAATLVGCGAADPRGGAVDGVECRSPRGHTVAREWNEMALDAIRRDNPEPTVHARNMYHLSAALWDVWVAYQPGAGPAAPQMLFADASAAGTDTAGRDQAMAAAGYVVIRDRYRNAVGAKATRTELDALLGDMCGPRSLGLVAEPPPESAWEVGVGVAQAVLSAAADDGSLEHLGYEDTSYAAVNAPLVLDTPPEPMDDPNRWQPLSLAVSIAQNGVPQPAGPQVYIGPQWGYVTGFALVSGTEAAPGLPVDPGAPPLVGSAEFDAGIIAVIEASAELATGVATAETGPAGRGANSLGADDGGGHETNPATGQRYEPNPADLGDYTRAVAEYWADGPESETPPGHWNLVANDVSDMLAEAGSLLVGGDHQVGDRVEWDVKLGLALNGALHDAAVAAWGSKRHYDYVRPISIIRDLGSRGELPIVPGLIEVIDEASVGPGGAHVELADHVGENAVWAWTGPPPESRAAGVLAGVGWIPASEWWPYQRPSFVTPSFPGYVSGHSAFSRAGAEVLAAFTGSEYFPDGLYRHVVPVGSLRHERGPSETISLQWATYFDAADEAGRSRIWGGIHFPVDDYGGRRLGSAVGQAAWDRSLDLFG